MQEGVKIIGHVTIEEINPKTGEVVSREEGENIICKAGADSIAVSFVGGSPVYYRYMVLSTDSGAVARSTTAIPATRFISTAITPTVAITGTTSIVTWVGNFSAQAGASPIWKFGMESATPSGGDLLNEYLFSAAKDNVNNDLKVTYNASIAP